MPVFVLLLLMMLAEIGVIVAVGQVLGLLVTLLLLVAVSAVGVAMLRGQGTRAFAAFGDAVRSRRNPRPEMVDGMLVAVAAGLVVLPGFISDALALFLLFPPTRALVRRRLLRGQGDPYAGAPYVVDAEVVRTGPVVIDPVREDRD